MLALHLETRRHVELLGAASISGATSNFFQARGWGLTQRLSTMTLFYTSLRKSQHPTLYGAGRYSMPYLVHHTYEQLCNLSTVALDFAATHASAWQAHLLSLPSCISPYRSHTVISRALFVSSCFRHRIMCAPLAKGSARLFLAHCHRRTNERRSIGTFSCLCPCLRLRLRTTRCLTGKYTEEAGQRTNNGRRPKAQRPRKRPSSFYAKILLRRNGCCGWISRSSTTTDYCSRYYKY